MTFFNFQSSDSAVTVTSKQKSTSSHSKKPLLKVHVPETRSKSQRKTYFPPTDNCASPLDAFGSSFLLRTSDLYNIVHIIDGDHDNNGVFTHDKSVKTRLIQHINDELLSPMSPIYSDVKTRRNLGFDMSSSPRSSSPSFPNDEEEIYIPYVLSPEPTLPNSQHMGKGRNSYDSGVGMDLDEKFASNDNKIENTTSGESNLDKSSTRDLISSTSSTRSNSSLHKSSLYGPNGIPPLFTSSVNDYIGNSVFPGSESWL